MGNNTVLLLAQSGEGHDALFTLLLQHPSVCDEHLRWADAAVLANNKNLDPQAVLAQCKAMPYVPPGYDSEESDAAKDEGPGGLQNIYDWWVKSQAVLHQLAAAGIENAAPAFMINRLLTSGMYSQTLITVKGVELFRKLVAAVDSKVADRGEYRELAIAIRDTVSGVAAPVQDTLQKWHAPFCPSPEDLQMLSEVVDEVKAPAEIRISTGSPGNVAVLRNKTADLSLRLGTVELLGALRAAGQLGRVLAMGAARRLPVPADVEFAVDCWTSGFFAPFEHVCFPAPAALRMGRLAANTKLPLKWMSLKMLFENMYMIEAHELVKDTILPALMKRMPAVEEPKEEALDAPE